MLLGEFRAKQSQDDKPPTRREPARTASVDYAPWSHPSLRSRRARKVCATWPLLPGLSFVLPTPARPFGLGSRCGEAPSDTGSPPIEGHSRQKIQTKNANARRRYHVVTAPSISGAHPQ